MTKSSLTDYTALSPNYSKRTQTVKKITVHHMAGVLTVEQCGNVFADSSRQASSNYGIGNDGRVGCYVEEQNQAWTSSSSSNDQQAITIEVSNSSTGGDWPVSSAAWNKLVDLCVDICKRYGIKQLTWTGDASGSLTCHYMFAPTACPGPYLKRYMPDLAKEVNAKLSKTGSWVKDSKGWWYKFSDGSYPKDKWVELDSWYYFDSNGYAICDKWYQIKGNWYLFDSNCHMLTGWQKKNGKWYYLESDGSMATGWIEDNKHWYYLKKDGDAASKQWVLVDGKWYYFYEDCSMASATCLNLGGKVYLVSKSGAMMTNITVDANGAVIF